MELIFEWVEADRGLIMLASPETGELEPAVSRNRKGTKADEKLSVSRTILDYVLQHKEGVLTSDAKDDERWDPAGSIVKLGVREAICVPTFRVAICIFGLRIYPGMACAKRLAMESLCSRSSSCDSATSAMRVATVRSFVNT